MAFKCTQNEIEKCLSIACKGLHTLCLINDSDLSYHTSSSPLVMPLPLQPPDLLGGSLHKAGFSSGRFLSNPYYTPCSMPLILSNFRIHIYLLVYRALPILDHQFCENRDHICFLPPSVYPLPLKMLIASEMH